MTKISDELREWCNLPQAFSIPCDELYELADRIDREMVELPKDRSGVPINVGDTVYSPNGDEFCAVEIIHTAEGICVKCKASDATFYRFFPCDISHERLDSWKRIANELEGLSVDSSDNYYVSTHCLKLADRIRKMAKEEGNGKGQD